MPFLGAATVLVVPVDLSPDEFDQLVVRALDSIPGELAARVENVVVLVEDEPPADDPDLLGYYDGVALTERESSLSGVLPDRIVIFRGPLTQMCDSLAELEREVEITVVHEVAHHFGIDDARLHRLGYG